MTDRDMIMLLAGAVIGYVLCFVVEIAEALRSADFDEPESEPEPPARHRAERDPADWWKECE